MEVLPRLRPRFFAPTISTDMTTRDARTIRPIYSFRTIRNMQNAAEHEYREYTFRTTHLDNMVGSLRALKYESCESISNQYRWNVLRVCYFRPRLYSNEFIHPPYATSRTVLMWDDDDGEKLLQYHRYPRQHTIEIASSDNDDRTIQITTDGDEAFAFAVLQYYRALAHTIHSVAPVGNNELLYLIRNDDKRIYIQYRTPELQKELLRLLQWDLARLTNIQPNKTVLCRDFCVVRDYKDLRLETIRNTFYKDRSWPILPNDEIGCSTEIGRVVTHMFNILWFGPAFINAINNYLTRRFLYLGSAQYSLTYIHCIHLRSVHSTTLIPNGNLPARENIRLMFSREILLICLKCRSTVADEARNDEARKNNVRAEVNTLLRTYICPDVATTLPGSFRVIDIFLHNTPCSHLTDLKTYICDSLTSAQRGNNIIVYMFHITQDDLYVNYTRCLEGACIQLCRPGSKHFTFAEGLYIETMLHGDMKTYINNMRDLLHVLPPVRGFSGIEITKKLYETFPNQHDDLFANTKSLQIHMNDRNLVEESNGFTKEGYEGVLICHICMVNATCVAYYPCGHMGMCVQCARNITVSGSACDEFSRICPMCTQRICYTIIINVPYINTYDECPGCIGVVTRQTKRVRRDHYYIDLLLKIIVHCNICFKHSLKKNVIPSQYLKVYI